MSTEQTWQIESTSSEYTIELAAQIGRKLKGGEIIQLTSDLGGGKTTFVKGLVAGAGSSDVVRSPSFSINNEYQAKHFTIHHFDLYRLTELGVIKDQLEEIIADGEDVLVLEWPQLASRSLPAACLRINIQAPEEYKRILNFSAPSKLTYLKS